MGRSDELAAALKAIAEGRRTRDVESHTLDFKAEGRSPKDTVASFVEGCLCFANGDGGMLVLGVTDAGSGPDAIVGTGFDADALKRQVYELTRPHLLVDAVAETHYGKRLVVAYVSQSPEIHSDTQGRAPRRIGAQCMPMTPQDQQLLREERQGVDWSAERSGRALDDVSPVGVAIARQHLRAFAGQRRTLSRASEADLLRALGLVDGSGALIRAGEVLLCEPRRGAQPRIVYQYKLTQAGEPVTVERLRGPLLGAYVRALELIQARRNLVSLNLPDGQQIQLEDFPEAAVREALANAVIHRDYHFDSPVVIEHSPAALVVTSPGPLVSGVTRENILTHPSKPRNVKLTNAARKLGLAEEVGLGIDRMFREMVHAGKDVPVIDALFDRVRITFLGGGPNTQIARYVAQLPPAERDDTDTMLTVLRLCSASSITAADMAPIFQKTTEEAEAVLRRLAGDAVGMLEPTRESARWRRPQYRFTGDALKQLGSAVRHRRRTTDEIDKKVFTHVREYGKVTNRTVQNLLDVGMGRAKQILQDLIAREVLVKVSEHERGPGVEYGPGPKFPGGKKRSAPSARQLRLGEVDAPRVRSTRRAERS
ncbi:MAG TPA: ATP-binding protein [Candidatus Limnocylindria bacterium]|nr:ATP-binding protein [Candidatus Limnocylindria bacterium]